MVKELNGRELVGFAKERQAHLVQILRSNKKRAKLVIIRDSDNPVIGKYVNTERILVSRWLTRRLNQRVRR